MGRKWLRFKRNKRGYYSLVIFLSVLIFSFGAEIICNDKPLLVHYQGSYYVPLVKSYPETMFGGVFETETDYKDPFFLETVGRDGNWAIYPPIRHDYNTINYAIDGPVPSPPTNDNILGTDDRGRDVFARLLYGFRISVLFGLALTAVGTLIGILAGSIQGFLGGENRSHLPAVY